MDCWRDGEIFLIAIRKWNGRVGGSKYFLLTLEGGVGKISDPNNEHPTPSPHPPLHVISETSLISLVLPRKQILTRVNDTLASQNSTLTPRNFSALIRFSNTSLTDKILDTANCSFIILTRFAIWQWNTIEYILEEIVKHANTGFKAV